MVFYGGESVAMRAVKYLEDDTISVKSKGLLAIMEYKGRAMTLEELITTSKDGYTSIQAGLQELTANGYYYSKPIRDGKGRFIRFEQRVRFSINRPILYCEKNIVHYLLSQEPLNEADIYLIKSSALTLSHDTHNHNEILAEINDCLYLGYPNAKTILEIVSRLNVI